MPRKPSVSPAPLLTVDAALDRLLSHVGPVTGCERVGTFHALGRVLAEPHIAPMDVPCVDNSAMDGYAVASRDIQPAGETRLRVSQWLAAGGSVPQPLPPGSAARVFTGACLPPGADAVAMQEGCRAKGDIVWIRDPVRAGQHVRRAGEDITAGEPLLAAGTRVRPQEMGLAASVGLHELLVYRRARVAIFSSGSELAEPGTPLDEGQLYNSNRYLLAGLLGALGCEVLDLGIVPDVLDATRAALIEAARETDLVVTTGGVSVGAEDHVRPALAELGCLQLWRVAVKPGKPLAFGHLSSTPVLGLPGNPAAAFVTFCLFGRPLVLRLQGLREVISRTLMARALFDYRQRSATRRQFLRARLESAADGWPAVAVHPRQGSAVLSATSWANGLAVIREGATVTSGGAVEFLPFAELIP